MDQTPFAQGVFPISLWTTSCLVGALIYLQILYAISYFTRPFSSSHREFPPFNKTINGTEAWISKTITGIVPLTAYSSATATQRQWRLSSGNGILNNTSPLVVAPPCPQPTSLTRSGAIRRTGSSIYDAMQNIKSSTRESLCSITSSAKAIFRQPSTSKPLLIAPLNGSPLDEAAHDELRSKPWEEFAQPLPVHQRPDRNALADMPAPNSAAARLAGHFSDPGPSSELETKKIPKTLAKGLKAGAVDRSEMVKMTRAQKYHSIESYPGKFPVSDSLDYSSLASAFAVRGRGTTSVRPFSDY
ncbi:uncharacterized protein N7506_011355 [Penicillium brevicompactum]|uniref:uncharacterized protein n=1 Tax=Penicillium brevicompactum TaxID=5074 RepID=UPI002540C567|nr:uncharacterized protein N7506_011355 [Penicillium brevicompactum]KAJ5322225.1 hypothetical protein N7506_011355 [Penicillium brevicompactum]